MREVREETGLRLTEFRYRALITFVSDVYETEYMHMYTACAYDGRLIDECNEGELQWVPVDQIMNLPMWEGDKLFLSCIMDESNGFFSMKLVYEGDRLVKHTLY